MVETVLVTGGAGFIGSHTVLALASQGYKTVVVDNLSNGHRDAVLAGDFIEADIRDVDRMAEIMGARRIGAVIHFAAFIEVGLSVQSPLAFYENNIHGSASLLEAMRRTKVERIVFSSTAAVYGNPDHSPVTEESGLAPTSPYGRTKLAVEQMLADCERAYGIRSVVLRYFNAAGADPEGRLGERHSPETHLIPLAIAAASGVGSPLTVFGDDYPTPDGTCIRDYIHVTDLAQAHVLALAHLQNGGASTALNVGTGTGYSVRQVLDRVAHCAGHAVPHSVGARRAGDPVALVAANGRILDELGWQPRHSSLEEIVETAWNFYRKSAG